MTVLVPMSPEVYRRYLPMALAAYAEANVAAGRWPREGALERSRLDFETLVPDGLDTPDHFFFEIKEEKNGSSIGSIWFALNERYGVRSAFVYDVEIRAPWRRKGHATRAFALLEERVLAMGLSSIGLHVFKKNREAQALYAKLGYRATSLNLLKQLDVKHRVDAV